MFKLLDTLFFFLEDPTKEFHVRELARLLSITPTTASKRLKELKNLGFLSYRKERMLDFYRANIENEKYRDLKVYYNIKKLRESELIKEINKFYLKPTIILFGSSAKGLDVKESDFDLVIISEKKGDLKFQKYEKIINRKIQLFSCKNLNELRNKHLINNVLNGIVVQGELNVDEK